METYRNEIELYSEEFGGRHLSKEELEKVEGFLEQLSNKTSDNDSYDDD
jgi:hypothetical protein